jgi:hypothetical protein
MVEAEVKGMQPHSVWIHAPRSGSAIDTITDHGMVDRSQMDPDLMRATRLEAHVQHR